MASSTEKQYVLIATPAYAGQIHLVYHQTVVSMALDGFPFESSIHADSLITRARNHLLALFVKKQQFSHLWFLDADIGLDDLAGWRLLNAKKDVIAAPVRLKSSDGEIRNNLGSAKIYQQNGTLLSVEHVGTGCLMLSRKAVMKLIEDAPTYTEPDSTNFEEKLTVYDVFQVGVKDMEKYKSVYLSEDYWICSRLRELGFEIWVDTSIETIHAGLALWQHEQSMMQEDR